MTANRVAWIVFGLLWLSGSATAAMLPKSAAIASADPLATAAGFEILAAGGNAFDAAVAVSAALAVVEPFGSGLGGGGFWLLHRASDGRQVMIDGRETAPLAAHRDMYLDERGEILPRASVDGPLAAGIPGEPAALVHIAEEYGRLTLARSLAPAILLARDGFAVNAQYRSLARLRRAALLASPAAAEQFLDNGEVPAEGHRIRQPQLAATLERIAGQGAAGFYEGPVAAALVQGVRAAGGLWSLEDLRRYRVVERAPVVGEYRGHRIVSAAPPSSGGVLLVEMLNMLAELPFDAQGEAGRVHLLTEVMRRAYRDRAIYLGDSDFVDLPLLRLLSRAHAKGLIADLDLSRATPSASLPIPGADESMRPKGRDTSHFSILDQEGNRVAGTLSINYPFGSGFVAPGTGVLLNDEMDDFSAKPGVPNVYGLIGAEANAIAPGKRMLSSMSPTFVEGPRGVGILGTPGGSRIISMVLLGILEQVDGAGPQSWAARARFHHQYLPDRLQLEPGALSAGVKAELERMGHTLQQRSSTYGNMQAVFWDRASGDITAASDPRGQGQASVRADLRGGGSRALSGDRGRHRHSHQAYLRTAGRRRRGAGPGRPAVAARCRQESGEARSVGQGDRTVNRTAPMVRPCRGQMAGVSAALPDRTRAMSRSGRRAVGACPAGAADAVIRRPRDALQSGGRPAAASPGASGGGGRRDRLMALEPLARAA